MKGSGEWLDNSKQESGLLPIVQQVVLNHGLLNKDFGAERLNLRIESESEIE